MYANIHNTRVYFDVDGAALAPALARPGVPARMVERPVLFLLHGGPGGDHSPFKDSTAPLRDTAQLVYVDHRGSGRSAPGDPSTYTLDQNIDDVDALRAHLGLERISVLGSSYGGMVAQGYAIRYPTRVANLALVATAPSYRVLDDARAILAARRTPDQRRVCQWLWDGKFETDGQVHEYFRVMGPMYAKSFDPVAFEANYPKRIFNRHQLNLAFGPGGFLRTFDWLPELAGITCPTLVLGGAHDWICPPAHSELIAGRIPRAHLKVFANSSHMIASDENEAYLATVRGFLTYAAR